MLLSVLNFTIVTPKDNHVHNSTEMGIWRKAQTKIDLNWAQCAIESTIWHSLVWSVNIETLCYMDVTSLFKNYRFLIISKWLISWNHSHISRGDTFYSIMHYLANNRLETSRVYDRILCLLHQFYLKNQAIITHSLTRIHAYSLTVHNFSHSSEMYLLHIYDTLIFCHMGA